MRDPMPYETARRFFSELFYGESHIPGKIKEGRGGCCDWFVLTDGRYCELGTYDYSLMTRMVFLAHDLCIRVQIVPDRGSRLRIMIDQRERPKPGDDITDRHPTIEQALATWRETHPAPITIGPDEVDRRREEHEDARRGDWLGYYP